MGHYTLNKNIKIGGHRPRFVAMATWI